MGAVAAAANVSGMVVSTTLAGGTAMPVMPTMTAAMPGECFLEFSTPLLYVISYLNEEVKCQVNFCIKRICIEIFQ